MHPQAFDYAAAAKLIEANLVPLIRNADLNPQWPGDSGSFWYQRQTAEGCLFTVVGTTSGKSRTAFDHDAVAAALKAGLKLEQLATAQFLQLTRPSLNADLPELRASLAA